MTLWMDRWLDEWINGGRRVRPDRWMHEMSLCPSIQEMKFHPKAQKSIKGQVGAPMPGKVLEVKVEVGQKVGTSIPFDYLSHISAITEDVYVNAVEV